MKKIDVINAIARCEGIKKTDKITAIEYLSNPETEFIGSDWKKDTSAPATLDSMITWSETPQGENFWCGIHSELFTMEMEEDKA
jgi:hypothetical protein